jgi:hypothetical protein
MVDVQPTALNCTQCGGELHPDEGQIFVTCPYCGTTVYLDKSQVVFHWYLSPTINDAEAGAALARWMSGSQTVKDLDKKARVTGQTFQYFPLWYFKWSQAGKEETTLEPASATSITELSRLVLPAGDLQHYDDKVAPQSVEPTVPLEAAREWLLGRHPGIELREAFLVHVPVYIFKYAFKDQVYTAVVEAATGSVIANIFPAKAEAPYLTAGCVTAAVYLCLAALPLFGGINHNSSGTMTLVAIGLAILAAPFLYAFAVYVASKV